MEHIIIEDSIRERYSKVKLNYALPKELVHQNLLEINDKSFIDFDGIILKNGEQFKAVDSESRHSFVYFALKEMGFDVSDALRICRRMDNRSYKYFVSSAKESQTIALTNKQIIGINNLLKCYHGLSWETLISSKNVFNLGFNINEDYRLGIENLNKIRGLVDIDYDKCVDVLTENSTFSLK